MKKQFLAIFATVALAWLGFKAFTLYKVVSLGPSYRAKIYCSCLWVTQQSESFCLSYSDNKIIPKRFVPLKVNQEKKSVIVENIFAKAEADYIGPTEGCRLR